MDTQEDLILPPGRMRVTQSAYSIHGHPGTPFVVATAVTRARDGTPVLCMTAIADSGITGNRTPGLVLAYGAANGNAGGVEPLPWGWKSWPELTWDAGGWCDPHSSSCCMVGVGVAQQRRGQAEAPALCSSVCGRSRLCVVLCCAGAVAHMVCSC
jgi:hypothetical protein